MIERFERDGLAWYTFVESGANFVNAMFTRRGGVSAPPFAALNLGSTVGDDPAAVAENHARALAPFGLTPAQVVSPRQVHGSAVALVGSGDAGTIIPQTDALITQTRGLGLLMRFADCTPVLFYDPVHSAVGLAHAGWRGVAAGVVRRTIEEMALRFGSEPERLWTGIGPAIDPEDYEVGPEVVSAITATLPTGERIAGQVDGRWRLDLPGAVAAQLRAAGVRHITRSDLYTSSRLQDWYSHRAENGHTGRFGVLILLP